MDRDWTLIVYHGAISSRSGAIISRAGKLPSQNFDLEKVNSSYLIEQYLATDRVDFNDTAQLAISFSAATNSKRYYHNGVAFNNTRLPAGSAGSTRQQQRQRRTLVHMEAATIGHTSASTNASCLVGDLYFINAFSAALTSNDIQIVAGTGYIEPLPPAEDEAGLAVLLQAPFPLPTLLGILFALMMCACFIICLLYRQHRERVRKLKLIVPAVLDDDNSDDEHVDLNLVKKARRKPTILDNHVLAKV